MRTSHPTLILRHFETRLSDMGCIALPLKTQSEFLLEMGLLERAGHLGWDADDATRGTLQQAVERLAGPEQMGAFIQDVVHNSCRYNSISLFVEPRKFVSGMMLGFISRKALWFLRF